jgi:hypothetical protein
MYYTRAKHGHGYVVWIVSFYDMVVLELDLMISFLFVFLWKVEICVVGRSYFSINYKLVSGGSRVQCSTSTWLQHYGTYNFIVCYIVGPHYTAAPHRALVRATVLDGPTHVIWSTGCARRTQKSVSFTACPPPAVLPAPPTPGYF